MKSEVFIALASTVIALCSFLLSLRQLAIQRKHNRLSVMPFIDVRCSRINHIPYKWTLTNAGAGPAVIKEMRFHAGRNSVSFPSLKMIEGALQSVGVVNYLRSFNWQKGDYFRVNEQVVIFEIDAEYAKTIPSNIKNLKWEIVYESIYGDEKTCVFEADNEG